MVAHCCRFRGGTQPRASLSLIFKGTDELKGRHSGGSEYAGHLLNSCSRMHCSELTALALFPAFSVGGGQVLVHLLKTPPSALLLCSLLWFCSAVKTAEGRADALVNTDAAGSQEVDSRFLTFCNMTGSPYVVVTGSEYHPTQALSPGLYYHRACPQSSCTFAGPCRPCSDQEQNELIIGAPCGPHQNRDGQQCCLPFAAGSGL